jgi:DNA-binding response OmpR family regulator
MPATVLIVDDDLTIAHLLRDFLKAEGFQVMVATDAEKALESMQHAHRRHVFESSIPS